MKLGDLSSKAVSLHETRLGLASMTETRIAEGRSSLAVSQP